MASGALNRMCIRLRRKSGKSVRLKRDWHAARGVSRETSAPANVACGPPSNGRYRSMDRANRPRPYAAAPESPGSKSLFAASGCLALRAR